jgi:glucose/arabinose dehydrogenase
MWTLATFTWEAGRHFGGLMDVSLHPSFDNNRLVYIAYVNDEYNMSVARSNLAGEAVQNLEVIFESTAFSIGSRIAWDEDGSVPIDNPIFEGTVEPTSIWSYGHRDPQGLYFDREEGLLYARAHGPLGGDELNVIEKGGNYGWPLFSYGLNYDGTTVGGLSEEEAGWFVMGSLFQHRLIAYDPASGRTMLVSEQLGRIRDVAQLPSGDLIVLLDSEGLAKGSGRVVRLTRAEPLR